MRVVAFSDTHGNGAVIERIISDNPTVKYFIFLGDGERELERSRSLHQDVEILYVCGNCDYRSFAPDTDIFVKNGRKLIFTHGHNFQVRYSLDRLYQLAKQNCADVALFGHTHCRYLEYRDGVYLMNPGSASLPRDGKAPSYGFIDIEDSGIVCGHVSL